MDFILTFFNDFFKYYFMYLTLMMGVWVFPLYYGLIYIYKMYDYLHKHYKYVFYGIAFISCLVGYVNYYLFKVHGYKGNPLLRKWFKYLFFWYIIMLLLPLLVWYFVPKWLFKKIKSARLFK